jgi:hypothetical protein
MSNATKESLEIEALYAAQYAATTEAEKASIQTQIEAACAAINARAQEAWWASLREAQIEGEATYAALIAQGG